MFKRARHSLPVFLYPPAGPSLRGTPRSSRGRENLRPPCDRGAGDLASERPEGPAPGTPSAASAGTPGRAGPSRACVAGLSDRDPKVRKETAELLGQIGSESANQAVPALVAAVDDSGRRGPRRQPRGPS